MRLTVEDHSQSVSSAEDPTPEFLPCVFPATPESNILSGLFLPTFHVHRPRHGRAADYLISIDGLRGGRMFHGSVCTSKSVWGFGSATPEASPVSLSFSWGGAQPTVTRGMKFTDAMRSKARLSITGSASENGRVPLELTYPENIQHAERLQNGFAPERLRTPPSANSHMIRL
ncbi:hypothetical protein D9C73_003478 [Collichthys lucidus]|uniref:Uncharacterized protein n=1 Tax=Collichthys lucidus TaxID=240159 RepID=A0A4U5U5B4_COLLU|nr:hypothetical protein D9C73_003478 [Collichthys lucidus]